MTGVGLGWFGETRAGWRTIYIPPFAEARRMGHPGFCGWLGVERRGLGGAGGLHPTLRRSAKDGAPGLFGLVESVEGCYVLLSRRRAVHWDSISIGPGSPVA